MRKAILSLFAFLAVAAVIGFVVTVGPSASDNGSGGVGGGGGVAGPAVGGKATAPERQGSGAADIGVVSDTGSNLGSIGAVPAIGPAVVKTAHISLEIGKGDFVDAFQAASLVASRYGGYVESSSTAGTKTHTGSLTIRVPSTSFDRAMTDLRGVAADHHGAVERESMSGQDVTSEYVDLNARLRTWQAQEAVLLKLMKQATSIEATLRVQTNLQDVQFRIEQIKGQLRVLENQTSLATIQVGLREAGAPVHVQNTKVDERPSLGEAWSRALNGFVGVVYVTVVGLGYLIPVTILAIAVWIGVRRLRPRVSTS
jgi:hypothetical protein